MQPRADIGALLPSERCHDCLLTAKSWATLHARAKQLIIDKASSCASVDKSGSCIPGSCTRGTRSYELTHRASYQQNTAEVVTCNHPRTENLDFCLWSVPPAPLQRTAQALHRTVKTPVAARHGAYSSCAALQERLGVAPSSDAALLFCAMSRVGVRASNAEDRSGLGFVDKAFKATDAWPWSAHTCGMWDQQHTHGTRRLEESTTIMGDCQPRFIVLTLANPPGLPSSSPLLRTAAKHGYTLRVLLVNKSDALEVSSPYMAKIPRAMEVIRAEKCARSVFMIVDGFDTFFVKSAAETLRAFERMQKGVVWSAEPYLAYYQGINKTLLDARARLPEAELHTFHAAKATCTLRGAERASNGSSQRRECMQRSYHARFLNAGGVIGYRDDLLRFFAELLKVRADAVGWRNRTAAGCPVAKGRQCAEQWAALLVLSHLSWERLNTTLDYRNELFYMAALGLHECKKHIAATSPSLVHTTRLVSPMVASMSKALIADIVDGKPWVQSNHTLCRQHVAFCRERQVAVMQLCRTLAHCLDAAAHNASGGRTRSCAALRILLLAPEAEVANVCTRMRSEVTPVPELYTMCAHPVAPAAWAAIAKEFKSGDRHRLLWREGQPDKMIKSDAYHPRWLGSFWAPYSERCTYSARHPPGSSLLWC